MKCCVFVFSIDSVMLLEQGFHVMSCDASDKMILHAFRERWARRKEEMFDSWGNETNLIIPLE